MCFLDDATSDYAITITTAQKLVYRVDAGALAHYKEGPRLRELSPPPAIGEQDEVSHSLRPAMCTKTQRYIWNLYTNSRSNTSTTHQIFHYVNILSPETGIQIKMHMAIQMCPWTPYLLCLTFMPR